MRDPGNEDVFSQSVMNVKFHIVALTARFDNLPKEFYSLDYRRYWSVCVDAQSFLYADPCLWLNDEKNKLIIRHIFIVMYALNKHNAKPPSTQFSQNWLLTG